MTSFYLIRHGDHSLLGKSMAGRMPGVPLSDYGKAQAAGIPKRMADIPISAIYSSPLQRAQETATPLAQALGIEIHTSDALNEVDFGTWTGMSLDALHSVPEWNHWNVNRSCTRPPGGEMLVEIQQRMITKIEALRCVHENEHVALFSHSDTIRAALTFYLGMPIDMLLRLEICPGSVSIVRLSEHGPDILCVNAVENLALL